MGDPARWERIWRIYEEVAALPPEEWSSRLAEACRGHAELRAQIEELLAGSPPPSDFLVEHPGEPEAEDSRPDPFIGRSVGPYRIEAVLGRGGMGVVYDARQEEPVKRRVALKLIRRGLRSKELMARFEAERQALAVMAQPGIARVFDVGATEDGHPYFAMEYVEGRSITSYCDEERLTTRERLELFLPVCDAVQHAHQKGIVHRDLKPSNIIVSSDDGGDGASARPIIIDFGVAKILDPDLMRVTAQTRIGTILGTPEYMSPEQWETAGDVDTRTDVYSLGVILYELLTGLLPLELEDKPFAEAWRIQHEVDPPRPSSRTSALGADEAAERAARRRVDPDTHRRELSGDLDWIVMKALEKDREHRYASASELAAEIDRHLRSLPVEAGPPSRLYRARKFVRRHRIGVAAATAFTLALIVGLGATLWMASRLALALEREATERATAEEVSTFLAHLFDATDPYSQEEGINLSLHEVLDRAARRVGEELGDQPLVQGRLQFEIGDAYARLGLADAAEPLLRASLETRRRALGENDPAVAESLERIGEVAWLRGDYPTAEELGRQALAIQTHSLSGPDLEMARSHDLIALAHRQLGDFDLAESHHQRALEIRVAAGNDPQEIAESHNLLGIVRRKRGDYDGAERSYRAALELWRRELGEGHPSTVQTMGNLALLLHVRGDYEESASMFEKLLPLRERLVGPDHPDIEGAKANFAKLLGDMGQLERADRLFRESLELNRRIREPDHPRIAAVLLDQSTVLRALGRFEEAEAVIEEALDIRRARFGEDDEKTVAVYGWLDELHREWRESEEPEPGSGEVEPSKSGRDSPSPGSRQGPER